MLDASSSNSRPDRIVSRSSAPDLGGYSSEIQVRDSETVTLDVSLMRERA
jgi:hypothetical protein